VLPNVDEIATVVVCEDDDPTRELLCDHLTADRYRALPAPSASDALRLCGYNQPDLMLLDLGLPDAPGIDVLREIRTAGERFDPEIGSLRTWLFAILRNVVIDLGRARASRPRVAEGGVEPSVEPLEQALLAWQVEEAMRRIGEDHRHVLIETHYRGRPYAEVAAELGVPEGTVKSRVYYGLRALRVVLEEMGYED